MSHCFILDKVFSTVYVLAAKTLKVNINITNIIKTILTVIVDVLMYFLEYFGVKWISRLEFKQI